MEKIYIKANINESTIYVSVGSALILEAVVDAFHDNHYKVGRSTQDEWIANIDYGTVYQVDTIEEVEEFIENNKRFRYEEQS